jgi:cytochrome c5
VKPLLPLALVLLSAPALAAHPWGGVDICETRRDIVPPGIDAALLPEQDSRGARLLQTYCTQCHNLPGPGRHTREEWPKALSRMETLMRVSGFYRGLLGPVAMPDAAEQKALQSYLEKHALRPLPERASSVATVGPERLYRQACGDCHAAPDPRAYPAETWPALLARMDRHRVTMARSPMNAAQRTAVEDFIGMAWGNPSVAGSSHQGPALPLPAPEPIAADPFGRIVSLAAFFGLAGVGLWRWRRGRH